MSFWTVFLIGIYFIVVRPILSERVKKWEGEREERERRWKEREAERQLRRQEREANRAANPPVVCESETSASAFLVRCPRLRGIDACTER